MHAAVVHHEDGRLFLIDLQSVRASGPCTPSLYLLPAPLFPI